MSRHLVQVLLPTHTRDRSLVAAEEFVRVRLELTERFGGVTAYTRSPASGLWRRDQDESIESDQVVMVEVVVDRFDRQWWTGYREQLETRFGQDQVHARVLAMEQI